MIEQFDSLAHPRAFYDSSLIASRSADTLVVILTFFPSVAPVAVAIEKS